MGMTSPYPQNLYLHFLDRELRRSIGATWEASDVFKGILTALCLAPGDLVCSYSHLWESSDLLQSGIGTIQSLITSGLLVPASDYSASADFLESRVRLYSHDAERYPFYFHPQIVRSFEALNPTALNQQGATETLGNALGQLAEGQPFHIDHVPPTARGIIETGLKTRNDRAITGTLFDAIAGQDKSGARAVRREISYAYTHHYLRETGADIVTGLPRLSAYDNWSILRPLFDHTLFTTLLGCAGIRLQTLGSCLTAIEQVAAGRNFAEARQFLHIWTAVVRGLVEQVRSSNPSWTAIAGHIIGSFRANATPNRLRNAEVLSFPALVKSLEGIATTLPSVAPSDGVSGRGVRVAFIVATDSEWNGFDAVAKSHGVALKELILPRLAAWQLSGAAFSDCVLIRTEMGSKGPSAATLVVQDVIQQLHPRYVIMPGIAFGMREDKTKLGDVLVAQWCTDYETVRQGETRVIPRGGRYAGSVELLAAARRLAARRADIHFGEVLSGDKLVDDPKFREQLAALFPDALGGEMEGTGLAASCQRYEAKWLLAKAICDWGKGKSDDHQKGAGRNAVEFCWQLAAQMP